jgi:hypothetical protein
MFWAAAHAAAGNRVAGFQMISHNDCFLSTRALTLPTTLFILWFGQLQYCQPAERRTR